MTPQLSIWLFRSAKKDDGFVQAFQQAGFQTVSVPVLSTEYQDIRTPFPTGIDSVVVTSRRSVEALTRSPEVLNELIRACPSAAWFAVGPATRQALANLGIVADSRAAGNASILAASIIGSGARNVLFLSGEPHRPELPRILESGGIRVHDWTLYSSHPVVPFELRRKPEADWAAFFSPRGVETALRMPGVDWAHIRKAAIGPTTADALRTLGWPADATAERPDPQSLFRAIAEASLAGVDRSAKTH